MQDHLQEVGGQIFLLVLVCKTNVVVNRCLASVLFAFKFSLSQDLRE